MEKKVALLDKLSQTGLDQITVGSFVSARYTPQMACMEELASKFHPRPGVTYLALALNVRGVERAQAYSPPLTVERDSGKPKLSAHLCDVFVRRNVNRSQADEIAAWPAIIQKARAKGVKEAGIGVGAAFGSNSLGDFPVEVVMRLLETEHALLDEAGIPVTELRWATRWAGAIRTRSVSCCAGRGRSGRRSTTSGYTCTTAGAWCCLRSMPPSLRSTRTTSCGWKTRSAASAAALIAATAERLAWCPPKTCCTCWKAWATRRRLARLPAGAPARGTAGRNAPSIETPEQAQHFRSSPAAYEGAIKPWAEPIRSPYVDRVKQGLPPYELDGGWPWNEDFFAKPSLKSA